VLCSDGIETAGVSVEEMGKLLLQSGDLDKGIKRVIERCRDLGAPDNITLAVARVEVDITATQALPKLTSTTAIPRLKKISQLQKGSD